MYSKEELQAKSVVQLKDIAKELGVKVKKSDNKETIVYAILDAQAEQPAPEAAPKRKRTRIATKKEDRVYSVHGNEGENFDVQKNQVLGPNGGETAPQAMSETAPAPAVEEEIQFTISCPEADSKPIRRRHRGSGTCQLPETPRQKKQG